MANISYGVNTSNFHTIYKVDHDMETVTALAATPAGYFTRHTAGAWDGSYAYFVFASNSQQGLWRFDTQNDSWTNLLLLGNNSNANTGCACDGVNVYFGIAGLLYAYNLASGTAAAIPGANYGNVYFDNTFVLWDGAMAVYAVSCIAPVAVHKFDLKSMTFHNNYPITGDMPSGGFGAAWAGGKLYIFCGGTSYFVLSDSETQLISTAKTFTGISLYQPLTVWAISSAVILATCFAMGQAQISVNVLSNVSAIAGPDTGSFEAGTFTPNIAGIFTFYEADGVTPLSQVEQVPPGTVVRPNQTVGPVEYKVQAISPRSGVVMSVNQTADRPMSPYVSVSNSPTGPFGASASLGTFAQGQLKSFYLKFTLPTGLGFGNQAFSLYVSSS